MTPPEKAERFRSLHRGPSPLVLPNAWDAASARVIELEGFPAIATTSAGVAFSLGYPDGQRVPREEMVAAIRRIASAVRVPVTADIESGYGDVAGTVRAVVEAGAIGFNIEDSWVNEGNRTFADVSQQLERIHAAREAAAAAGVPAVLNARTDVFLYPLVEESERVNEAIRRLTAYVGAGADCAFPIGARDREAIRRLVMEIPGPVNILAMPGTPDLPELAQLGVARVSFGSGLTRASMGLTRRIARQLKSAGSLGALLTDTIPSAEANRMFERE